jgi:hypothetical protein
MEERKKPKAAVVMHFEQDETGPTEIISVLSVASCSN